MKTPREILFARHRSVEPKLDTIRQEAVAAAGDRRAPGTKLSAGTDRCYHEGISFWRELFLTKPRAWAGLAAVNFLNDVRWVPGIPTPETRIYLRENARA